ncbi:cobalt ABC transporter substrate-binding protein CbiN [Clostridium botulinum]|uniref:energy-coupling factor ABC transporter substrate-binding protein n=1 Tax=Clostridium botulinum TaxID=1491 RepID=UPI0005F8C203|nr:energy-coupling factor ABC transporter substrate-binding protein [Clostridium botulinum]MBN3347072.1 cobalt ABC transporter substrate-binding protein CbiN [Clostridium botulinum]
MKKQNIIITIVSVVVILASLFIGGARGGEFAGADDEAEGIIEEMNKDYEPWFESIWEPPSGEIESLLFASQAALGAGVIGYYIGKKKNAKNNNASIKNQ